jgi:hypothetical protein
MSRALSILLVALLFPLVLALIVMGFIFKLVSD